MDFPTTVGAFQVSIGGIGFGDAFIAKISAVFVITVPAGGDTVTITAGETANYELVLAPAGFVGTVTLTCTGAPAGTDLTEILYQSQ